MCSKLTLFRLRLGSSAHTHKRTCSVCTRGCFVMGVRFVLNDFLFELVVKAPEPNHFPSLSLGPSVGCTIAAALPSAAWPQFNLDKFQLEFG